MKKAMYLMLAMVTVLLSACSSDDDGPSVQFAQNSYSLISGSVAVRLNASNVADGTRYPVTFGGTAVKDQDYTVDAEAYVIGGTNAVTTINVTAKNNFTSDKTIIMTVDGATTTINLGVQDKRLYTFSQKSYIMGEQVDVTFTLTNAKDGSRYQAPNDIEISLQPQAASTAVEGTNYEFVNKTATIKAGDDECTFTLKRVNYEAGKDTIVLAPVVTEAEGFVGGSYPTTTVAMISSAASDLMGEWQMSSLETDPTYFKSMWGTMIAESEYNGLPELNTNDSFTFAYNDEGEPTLTTSLQSTFQNYFQPTSTFSLAGEYTMHVGMFETVTMQLLSLNNVNRYFSATQKSEDTEALLGVVNNVVDGQTVLDVYLIDYEAKDFFQSFADYGLFEAQKPMASMSGVYFHFTLKKK